MNAQGYRNLTIVISKSYTDGQYLGALDSFGAMNSGGAGNFYGLWLNKEICWIPNAWHHLNTELPFHMSIRDVLKRDDAATRTGSTGPTGVAYRSADSIPAGSSG